MATFLFLLLLVPRSLKADAGSFGAYPMHGGNHMKQQIALESNINSDNIHSLDKLCTFSQDGIYGYTGYPVVDNDNNAYFTDNSGYKSMDIDTCTLNWEVTNYDFDGLIGMPQGLGLTYGSLNTPALIQTDAGDKAVLFGWHLWAQSANGTFTKGCYMVALRLDNGSILYTATITDVGLDETGICIIHGVMVEGSYAYGGTSNSGYGFGMEMTTFTADGPQLSRLVFVALPSVLGDIGTMKTL